MHDQWIEYRVVTPSRFRRAIVASAMLAALSIAAARATAAAPLPTSAELHQQFDAGQYQPLLTQLASVLPLNGAAGQPYDKLDLTILKTNALIATKQQPGAIRAAADAVKLITAKTDPAAATQARALQVLLAESPKLAYTPEHPGAGTPAKPIPLDLPPHDAAYQALQTDLAADVDAKSQAAKTGKTLGPVVDAINRATQWRSVELVATQSDDQAKKALDDLFDQAKTMLDDAAKAGTDRVGALRDKAEHVQVTNFLNGDGTTAYTERTKHGIDVQMRRELDAILVTSDKIQSACNDLAKLSDEHAADFTEPATETKKTTDDATSLLQEFVHKNK